MKIIIVVELLKGAISDKNFLEKMGRIVFFTHKNKDTYFFINTEKTLPEMEELLDGLPRYRIYGEWKQKEKKLFIKTKRGNR